MGVAIDEEHVALALRGAVRQRHGFRRRRALVEQRGIGDIESGKIADHGLEIEQRLEPALADLRLVGCVGGVPGRILQDIALDHRGQQRAVVALADQRGDHGILRGDLAHVRQRLALAQRVSQIERRLLADRRGQRFVHQRCEAPGSHRLQHTGDITRRGPDMAAREGGGGVVG